MYTLHETILTHMILSGNNKQVGYPLAHEALKMSWYKLFKKTKESIVRKWIDVTNGYADYPSSAEDILGFYVVDSCGDLAPLYEDNTKADLVKPKKKCSCTSCDDTECLCPTIQDTIVQTEVTIEGETYTNKVHTRVLKNGEIVEETFTWVPQYDANGNFTTAREVPAQSVKCSLSVQSCGCIENTAENIALISGCGCIIDCYIPALRERYPALQNDFGYYKKDDDNRKVKLFNKYGKRSRLTQVEIVYQSNGADMLVPEYARPALIALLDWSIKMYSPVYDRGDREEARRNFNREKMEMLKELNPIPYEWFVQVGDATRKPYYVGIHSDFIAPEVVTVCTPATASDNITNITYSTVTSSNKWLRRTVDVGDGPTSGIATYQHDLLKGLGNNSDDEVEIEIEKVAMYNWGTFPDFSIDKVTGTITLLNGLVWQTGGTLKVELTQ